MPHQNGRIYVDTTTSPYKGVSYDDVQAVLGITSKYDIGGLIANGDINKWSKYKPVKNQGVDFASQRESDYTWKSSATWWKAYDGQCGLTFTTESNLGTNTVASSGFLYDLRNGNLGWGYGKPTGGVSQYPYRLFDFLQYYHYAPKPVVGVFDNLRLYNSGHLTVQLDENRGDSSSVQLSDLTISNSPVGGWYVGILIYRSASQFTFAFSENTIGGTGSLDVEFANMTPYGGQYATIVPFLSSVRSNQGVDPGAGIFVSCDVAPQSVLIRAEVQAVVTTIDAIWMDTFRVRTHYAVNIINNTGSQVTVRNLRISLFEDNVEVDYDTFADFTIAGNDAHEEAGTVILSTTYDPDKTYTVVVTSSTTGVSGSEVVNDPRN